MILNDQNREHRIDHQPGYVDASVGGEIFCLEFSHNEGGLSEREALKTDLEMIGNIQFTFRQNNCFWVELNTCNRYAIYGHGDMSPAILELVTQLTNGGWSFYQGRDAVVHLFSTAAGLCSKVLGEHQILGQIKGLLEKQHQFNANPVLNELIRCAITTGKLVRTKTSIGRRSISVSAVALDMARGILNDQVKSTLVIGTGKMAELTIKYMVKRPNIFGNVVVVSHDQNRANEISRLHKVNAMSIQQGTEDWRLYDLIIGATNASVLLPHDVHCPRHEMTSGGGQRQVVLDLGMPRNFPQGPEYDPSVTLVDLDSIQMRAQANSDVRLKDLPIANSIVASEADYYVSHKLGQRLMADQYKTLWNTLNQAKDQNLAWLLPKMGDLTTKEVELLNKYAHRLVRQISTPYFQAMRQEHDWSQTVKS